MSRSKRLLLSRSSKEANKLRLLAHDCIALIAPPHTFPRTAIYFSASGILLRTMRDVSTRGYLGFWYGNSHARAATSKLQGVGCASPRGDWPIAKVLSKRGAKAANRLILEHTLPTRLKACSFRASISSLTRCRLKLACTHTPSRRCCKTSAHLPMPMRQEEKEEVGGGDEKYDCDDKYIPSVGANGYWRVLAREETPQYSILSVHFIY